MAVTMRTVGRHSNKSKLLLPVERNGSCGAALLAALRGSNDPFYAIMLSLSGASSIYTLLAGPAGSTFGRIRSEGRALLAARMQELDVAIVQHMRAGGADPQTSDAQLIAAFAAQPAAERQRFFEAQRREAKAKIRKRRVSK